MQNQSGEDAMEHCVPGFAALSLPKPHQTAWVLGDLFLSKYYMVFDRDHNRIGFGLPPVGSSLHERVKIVTQIRAKALAQEKSSDD